MKKIIAISLCLALTSPCYAMGPRGGKIHTPRHQVHHIQPPPKPHAYHKYHKHHRHHMSTGAKTAVAVAGIAGVALLFAAIAD